MPAGLRRPGHSSFFVRLSSGLRVQVRPACGLQVSQLLPASFPSWRAPRAGNRSGGRGPLPTPPGPELVRTTAAPESSESQPRPGGETKLPVGGGTARGPARRSRLCSRKPGCARPATQASAASGFGGAAEGRAGPRPAAWQRLRALRREALKLSVNTYGRKRLSHNTAQFLQ